MYNGIGLLTARGSGTSGHVQSNSFNIRSHARNPQDNGAEDKKPARVRKADDRILEHERKREIELKLLELTESLEDSGYATAEIEQKVNAMRQKMLLEHASMSEAQKLDGLKSRDDTHALAKRKEAELERFKQAFGVQGDQNEEEAGEVKAIEAPPERLMIEPAKPAVPERFAAAEKALEEQLLREEQEELEREREKRMKRQEEKRRRKEEKAAAEAAERARIEEERAREEQQRRELEERKRAEEHAQRRHDRPDRHPAYEGGSRGDHYHHRRSQGPPRGSPRRHGDDDSAYRGGGYRRDDYERMHERSRREGAPRNNMGTEDRYVEEVGPMGRDREFRDREHGGYGGYKRPREEMHEHHDNGAARECERERRGRQYEDGDRAGRGAEDDMHERHARRRYDSEYERERSYARHSEREDDQARRHQRRAVEPEAHREYSREQRNGGYRDEKRPREYSRGDRERVEHEQHRGRERIPGTAGGERDGARRQGGRRPSHSSVDSGGSGRDRDRVRPGHAHAPDPDSRGQSRGRGSGGVHAHGDVRKGNAPHASRTQSAPRRERSSDVDDQDHGGRGRGRRSRSAPRRSRSNSQSPSSSNSGDSLSFGSSSDGSP